MTLYLPSRYDAVEYQNTDLYGINYLVKDKDLGMVAACRINKKPDFDRKQYALLEYLVDGAHRMDHQSILPLMDAFCDADQGCTFLISRGAGPTLFEYLEDVNFHHIYVEEDSVLTVLVELTNAILYPFSAKRRTDFTEALTKDLPLLGIDPICISFNNKGHTMVDYAAFLVKTVVRPRSQFTSVYLCPEVMQLLDEQKEAPESLTLSKALTYNVGRLCCDICFAGSIYKAPCTTYDTAYMLNVLAREQVYSKDLIRLLQWLTNSSNELRPHLDEVLTHPFVFRHIVHVGAREHDRIFRNTVGSTQLILSANMNKIEYVRLLLHKQKRLTNYDGATALMAAAILGHLEIISMLIPYEAGMQMITGDTLHGATALILAAINNKPEACRLLASREANLRKRDGFTALMEATVRGYESVVDVLIQHEAKTAVKLADANSPKNGTTALMLACEFYQFPIASRLIPYEAGMRDISGYTALHRSAALGLVPAVELLVTTKEVGMQDLQGLTALMFAVQYGHCECAKVLCRTKETRMKTDNGHTALFSAILHSHIELCRLLAPLEKDICLDTGYTPLMCAVEHKQGEAVDLLKDSLVGKAIKKSEGWKDGATALMLAAYNNDEKSCRSLLAAEQGMRNSDGMTALMIAASNDCTNALSVLCTSTQETKSTVSSGKMEGRTALMFAAMTGSLHCAEILISKGLGVRAQDAAGSTALIIAALFGHADLCKLLAAEEGRMRRKDGLTAMMCAAQEGHKKCVAALLSKEGDMHKQGGWTALMSAALKDRPMVVQLLSQDKRQIRRKRESDGVTALMISVQCGHVECIRILAPIERAISDKKGRHCDAYAKTETVRKMLRRLR